MLVEENYQCGRARGDASARLKGVLLLLASRTTEDKTLGALADLLGIRQRNISVWIRAGEVPPIRAGELMRLPGANPPGESPITLDMLTPSLF